MELNTKTALEKAAVTHPKCRIFDDWNGGVDVTDKVNRREIGYTIQQHNPEKATPRFRTAYPQSLGEFLNDFEAVEDKENELKRVKAQAAVLREECDRQSAEVRIKSAVTETSELARSAATLQESINQLLEKLGPPGTAVSGHEVYHSPEWRALCGRFGWPYDVGNALGVTVRLAGESAVYTVAVAADRPEYARDVPVDRETPKADLKKASGESDEPEVR